MATDISSGLREALIETLTNILSPQAQVRKSAEEQIKILEVTEGKKTFQYIIEKGVLNFRIAVNISND